MAKQQENRFPKPTLEGLPKPRRHPVPKRTPRAGMDEYGRTPLWAAAAGGEILKMRELLLAYADPSAADDDGWTPLHVAAQNEQVEAARLLLEAGADPDKIDHHGNGPLWVAAHHADLGGKVTRHREIITLLLNAGADPEFQNRYGKCPRDILERKQLEG